MKGAKHWLTAVATSQPDMFVALDVPSNLVWYGALRIDMLKFYLHVAFQSIHTLYSRGTAEPRRGRSARAIECGIRHRLAGPRRGRRRRTACLRSISVCLAAERVTNAIPVETWFTVDLRSPDTPTHDRLRAAMIDAARRIADEEHVGLPGGTHAW